MRALIGIGANLGDRETTIARACDSLDSHEAISIFARSDLFETSAIGGSSEQPKFLNAAAVLETKLAPSALLNHLQKVERMFGRTKSAIWNARPLDLDILLYGDRMRNRPRLQIPHRFLPFRRFVLDPACEIAGDWVHPALHCSLDELRKRLIEHPLHFAFGGFPIEIRDALLQRTREAFANYSHLSCEVWHGQSLADRAIVAGDPDLLREAAIWQPHADTEPRAIFFLDVGYTDSDSPQERIAHFLKTRVLSDCIPYLFLDPQKPDDAFREVCGAISAGINDDSIRPIVSRSERK